uniref:kelch-like protein 9 n=1 Tax=Ciona intestinalis TaxID=7719 RepID=UPI00006A5214|nr:kelch-like protein 9 [Ciona intestinalis]|eukprot:XP_009858623.1 kelch-like protein 9 [Ciona intestinalis]
MATRNGKVYSSQRYSQLILVGFFQLRVHGSLCDVTLTAEGKSFKAHRGLLASASDYFRAMFTSEMKESFSEDIELHGVSSTGLEQVLRFIYSGEIVLSLENIHDILAAASHLQVTAIMDFCNEFLISEVTLENCVDIGHIANAYNLEAVDHHVNVYMLQNFNLVSDFNKVPFDRLTFLLSSNTLKGCSELQLFNAAKRWIEGDVDNRMKHAAALMENIRFPLVNPTDLITHIQTVDFMRTDNACMRLLLEASNYQMVPYMQPILQTPRTSIRSDATHLVTLGGVLRHQLDVSKDLRVYDEKSKRWINLAPMENSRYQHGIAVIGNFLFVVGGQSNYDTKGKTAVDTVFRYDPRYNKWIRVRSLNEKRTFFHLSAIEGKLYAVGGRNAAGELSTVECYNPQHNEWVFVEKMQEPHYGHAGTVYNGQMFISGGITHDSFQKKLLCYNPTTDKWEQRSPMSTVRGLHCMTTVRDRLYVIGGNHFKGTTDYDDVLECEFYTTETDQWCCVAPMLTGQSDVGIAVYDGKVYVTGGYSWNNRCMVDIVQCYDPEENKWMKTFSLPAALGGIRACTLTVLPNFANSNAQSSSSSSMPKHEPDPSGDMMLSVDRPAPSARLPRRPQAQADADIGARPLQDR